MPINEEGSERHTTELLLIVDTNSAVRLADVARLFAGLVANARRELVLSQVNNGSFLFQFSERRKYPETATKLVEFGEQCLP
jgi:hypothetical protein